MQKICISKNWQFTGQYYPGWREVDLPHDYAIGLPRNPNAPGGAANGFFDGGSGRYVKYLNFTNAKHQILDLDGAYMNAEVRLNGNLLAIHPYGYTPFLVELTPKIRAGGINKLEITTNDNQPSTRWYSGAGLYRDVFLWTGGEVRVEPWDIFVKTPVANENQARVEIRYEISADVDGEATVTAEIPGIAAETASVSVKAGEKAPLTIVLIVKNPALWTPETPNLYRLHSTIQYGGQITDTADTEFGIRTISADAEHGFLLNGKPRKLRGGCIHHDHGVLGAAAFPAAEERKLRLLKEAGFDAVRIAHYPPSLALLEVCDRLGMLVMDEAFDMWNQGKNARDYHLWFADWYARDLTCMVGRDRNHPCVISYSIGNEIGERDGKSDGAFWARTLAAEIRKHDDTRFITSGICGCWYRPEEIDPPDYLEPTQTYYGDPETQDAWAEYTREFMAPLDIVGYNYFYGRYEKDHETYPQRVIWGSETHAIDFYDSWHAVLRNSHVIGDFTWTAYDNLGEAGTGRSCWARDGFIPGISLAAYPWRTCYQGDLDLCGYRRPQSYFREAVWIGGKEPKIFTTHPEHYGEGFSGTHWHWYDVLDTWTFADQYLGKPVKAEVYTDAEEIVWYLNGRELGRSKPEKGIATFDIPYEKGTLAVDALKNGRVCGHSELHTVGAAAKVSVVPEKTALQADNRDLCYFRITVEDAAGSRVPDAGNELVCLTEGGELLGIFSGDPKNEDQYTSNRCHAFQGRALAVVRTGTPGTVKVTVGSAGLANGSAAVTAI